MAKGYVRHRRDDLMLLPVDVRDWLPVDHVVWLLLDVVGRLDTSALHARAKLGGAGRAPYDPDMLLALLLYAYSGGLHSSRKIERRCHEDVSFMVLTGLARPDHVTISRFRKDNADAMAELFDQVLVMCRRAGLVQLNHVAFDGTKIAADASVARTRDADGLRGTGRRWLNEAARVDEEEDERFGDNRGDELPAQLRDPQRRKQIVDELIEQAKADPDRKRGRRRERRARQGDRALDLADDVHTEAEARAEDDLGPAKAQLERAEQHLTRTRAQIQAQYDAYQQRAATAAAAGRRLGGNPAVPVEEHSWVKRALARVEAAHHRITRRRRELTKVTGKRNLTDPDARFMPVRGGGFVLGYNAQLAVSADHFIIGYDLVQDTGDAEQLQPMIARLDRVIAKLREAMNDPAIAVGVLLADAGYASAANLELPGPDRIIALGSRRSIAGDDPPTSPPGPDATPRQRMAYKLSTVEGRTLYKKRGATVEPVNGHLKDTRGLRRFHRRGLDACTAELGLVAITHNLIRMLTLNRTAPAAAA